MNKCTYCGREHECSTKVVGGYTILEVCTDCESEIGADNMQGIRVKGHRGKWSSIASETFNIRDGRLEQLHLMEHDTYGEDAAHVIVDDQGELIADDIYNGFDDLRYMIEHHQLSYERGGIV